MMKRIALAASLALALAACQDDGFSRSSTRHLSPIPPATMALMAEKGMSKNDPILIRSYKKESEMEVWKRGSDGKYALLKTYPICRWSGQLGPKIREGDRQAPEGFYAVTPGADEPELGLLPVLRHRLSRTPMTASFGRSGGDIMVHGSCSSRGCFAMTDQNIAEIYSIARESFASGQRAFQFQSYPFRMTRQEPGRAPPRPEHRLLEEPEGRLRLFRGHQGRAARRAWPTGAISSTPDDRPWPSRWPQKQRAGRAGGGRARRQGRPARQARLSRRRHARFLPHRRWRTSPA